MILKLIKKIIDLLKNNRKDEHIFIKESDINIFNKYQSQKFKDERKAECPYCFKQLYKIPGAKTKCPHCNNYMLVRTNTNNVRTVVTLTEANKIDNDWSIINGQEIRLSNNTNQIFEWKKGEKSFVNNFMKMVGNSCKITENDIFVRRQKLNNIDDTLWSLSQEYLLINKKNNNFDNIISIYSFLEFTRISEGKNANYLIKLRLYYELLRIKKERRESGISNFNNVSVMASDWSGDSTLICSKCKELDGKEFTIDEAIRTQPLPPDGCTCKHCDCQYI